MAPFSIERALPLEGPARFTDGRVAALDPNGSFLITSPNTDFVPEIVQGIVNVVLCADGRYGVVDPLQWPQIYTPRYCYLSAILKPVGHDHPWRPMFRAPSPQDFVVTTGTPVGGFGLLTREFVAPFHDLVSQISQHIHAYLHDQDRGQCEELQWHEVAMRHALSRLALMSATYPDQVLQVAELQRHWLMAVAYLEYQRRVRGLTKIGDGFSCVEHDLIGAWTSDPPAVQSLYAANIPVWFVRHVTLLHDGIRIGRESACMLPTSLSLRHFPGVDAVLFHGLVGESHLSSMMQGGHGYLDISRVPSAAVYTISDFSGALSIRESKALHRMGSGPASSSQSLPHAASHGTRVLPPGRTRPKPYDKPGNRTVHPSQIRGRDKFLEFSHEWMPPPLQSWLRAMSAVDRSMPARAAQDIWGYWIPEPALLLGPNDDVRRQRYVTNWVRARPIWLYLLHVPDSAACKVAPQLWRSFLNGVPEDPTSTTRSGKRLLEIKNIFAGVFRDEDFDTQTQEPVIWHGKSFQVVPDDLASAIIWEVFELGFRYELLALDRYLRPLQSRGRQDETRREDALGRIFPGGWLRTLDSLPSPESHGLFASLPHRRLSALNALQQILARWPGCPDRISSASPLQLADLPARIEEFEYDLATFYIDSFFFCSGRAPLVPHMYPA